MKLGIGLALTASLAHSKDLKEIVNLNSAQLERYIDIAATDSANEVLDNPIVRKAGMDAGLVDEDDQFYYDYQEISNYNRSEEELNRLAKEHYGQAFVETKIEMPEESSTTYATFALAITILGGSIFLIQKGLRKDATQ